MLKRLFVPLGVCLTFFALTMTLLAGRPVRAAPQVISYVVDRTDDPNPAGLACTGAANDCSLRAAVIAANANPGSNVFLSPGTTYNLTRAASGMNDAASGDLNITADMTVVRFCFTPPCGGTAVAGGAGWADRIFMIEGNAHVNVNSLTIRDGHPEGFGGGFFIDNGSALTLTNSVVMSNSSGTIGTSGIYNMGQLIVRQSQVVSNTKQGIYNSGNLTLIASRVAGNHGSYGGGIQNTGVATIVSSTIVNNYSFNGGGGLYNSNGSLTIRESLILSNATGGPGGGLVTEGALTLINSTLGGNRAYQRGGGLFAEDDPVLYTVTLHNVTIAFNEGNSGGGGIAAVNLVAPIVLSNTLVANNTDNLTSGKMPDCAAVIVSRGYNLIEDTAGCLITGNTSGNLTEVDPQLGPLQDNGGGTETYALWFTSPAINAGNFSGCPATDQRGVARPGGPRCDIGAYEYDGPPMKRVFLPLTLKSPGG